MRTMLRCASTVACGGVLISLIGVAAPPAMGQQDPPGNNGTVKVDDVPFDDHPNNEPHVGCVFEIDLYGYDEGDLEATITFEGVPPTGGGELLTDTVSIGEDAAGGGTDLDASQSYDLSDALANIEPHPRQGHHVRLTVHAEGSQGADVKHKVFWVEDCVTPPPPTTPTTVPGTTVPETTPGGQETAPPATPVVGPPNFTG